ncbi:ABC1 kinase family protein [Limosilactobacillus antri]|uniref:ABC1 family protein n=1 Tax=Limosilactobacillus antri DSM 16041 TaxID=525309 RepID=C8P8D0_9LACO|nr:AarF/UbiB family protein [Limosilactobacillus antri]EEW53228.1 ABC1 family protein [Limosilactobacillus antri DSM 16041]KRK57893.1 ABC1 family protein kinase [Limosilactobacillus antri DSM 16041]
MENQQQAEIKQGTRLREIIAVMRKYHFISNFYHQRDPEAICNALQELGPTFIKLGQILSTRPDLVSADYVRALRKLQDQVTADSFASVQQSFEEATGKTIAAVFKEFDQEPFASASIGQVHHATLLDGTPVVVKVQHPAVTQLVNTDLALLRRAVKMVKYVPANTAVVDLDRTLDEISSSLLSEINTLQEAHNGEEFYRLNNGQGIFAVPKVYPSYCAPRILVNQAMTGKSIRQLFVVTTDAEQERNRSLATALVRNFMKQVFVDHFFHADPHPGNILFATAPAGQLEAGREFQHSFKHTEITYQQQRSLPPYRLVYLDFGMMGRLTPVMADGIAEVVLALTSKDQHRIAQAVLGICNQTGELDQLRFTKELAGFMRPYLAEGLGQIDFSNMLYRIIRFCEKNHLQIKPEVTMLIKAFGTLESTVARLDPDISMMAVARPFGLAYLRRKFKARDLADDSLFKLWSVLESAGQLPERIDTALDTFNSGDIEVKLRYPGQRQLLKQVERVANRLLVVIVLAAVILGSSLLIESSTRHPHIYHLGVFGYAISIGVIIVLIVSELWHRIRRWHNNKK